MYVCGAVLTLSLAVCVCVCVRVCLSPQVMTKICREAEASLDYYAMFKNILKQAPLPMSPLESLASSAVRTAHKVHASLIVVLTRGGSTARLVAKYRPLVGSVMHAVFMHVCSVHM